MTDIDVYQPSAGLGQYQAGIVMTPESAKALDDQVRLCTEAVLREGTDYGVIPGTSGEKTLWRPGAQKLLQWFRLECACERIEVERDDDGRKHGITYRAEVGRGLKTATPVILATCEGTADYDESKFYQSAEEVQRKAEARERKFAKVDGRVANPTKWKGDPARDIPPPGEYRADWNALMKRAQKRAIVGAVNDATAAGGIFTDREEDDAPAPPEDDGPSWYEQALEAALTFTDKAAGRQLHVEAAQAARDGLCTPRQASHVQNRIAQRARLLKTATPVDVEDLGRQAPAAEDDTRPGPQRAVADDEVQAAAGEARTQTDPRAAGAASPRGAQPPPPQDPILPPSQIEVVPGAEHAGDGTRESAPEDQPGSASADQLQSLHIILGALGFGGSEDDRKQKLKIAETITGRDLGGTSKNLSCTEARKLAGTLDGFGGDGEKLIEYMAGAEQDHVGDGDA